MEILIGINPDTYDDDAMALGSLLARGVGSKVVLAHVYPASFDYPGTAHVDAEWVAYLQEQGQKLLDEASARFKSRWQWDDADVDTVMIGHQSSGIGLAELAAERGSAAVVIGSAPGAPTGRFAIGSTANQLLHESTAPIAAAPSGYAREEVQHVGKVTIAFQNAETGGHVVEYGAWLAEQLPSPLALMTVVLRHRVYGSKLGADAEGGVLMQAKEDAARRQAAALAEVPATVTTESFTVVGESVSSALASASWSGDEILLIGSATRGPLLRVFLGDMTHKLLRSSPVPVLIVPRPES